MILTIISYSTNMCCQGTPNALASKIQFHMLPLGMVQIKMCQLVYAGSNPSAVFLDTYPGILHRVLTLDWVDNNG